MDLTRKSRSEVKSREMSKEKVNKDQRIGTTEIGYYTNKKKSSLREAATASQSQKKKSQSLSKSKKKIKA